MASAMASRLMRKTNNTIKINQTQKGGDNIVQSQSIHITQNISGDGNHVVGIHVDSDGNIIDHTVPDTKTVDEMRDEIFKFNHYDEYSDWTIDDEIAVDNMRQEDKDNRARKAKEDLRNILKMKYHTILNTDAYDKPTKPLEEYLHFTDTNAYKEGYVLIRQVIGTNISETYRILPAFITKKLERVTGQNTIKEWYRDPIIHTDIYRACNYYYRVSDGALFALIPYTDSKYNLRLEECSLIQIKYFRDGDVSAYVFYDPKNDYLYTKDDNTIVCSNVTKTNMEKLLKLLWRCKLEIFLLILIAIVYIAFH